MKTVTRLFIFTSASMLMSQSLLAAPFTPGNLTVIHVGDGVAPLGNAATVAFLDEFTTGGAFVQAINLPLPLAGNATSEGALARSEDQSRLAVGGYQTAVGTPNLAATTSGAVPRGVTTISANGVPAVMAVTTSQFSQGNIRGAVTDGGNNFWASGNGNPVATAGGVNYLGNAFGPNLVLGGNLRWAKAFNGSLYFSSGSATAPAPGIGIHRFAGMPLTASASSSVAVGAPGTPSPYGFSVNPADTILYVADDRVIASGGGIQRWNKVAGIWTLVYTLGTGGGSTVGARGVVVNWSGPNPIIYATTAEASNNRLIVITDTGAGSPATTLTGAGVNRAFRGVEFTPIPPPVVSELENFFRVPILPPTNGVYRPPWYAQINFGAIVISNVSHRTFSTGQNPPPLGQTQNHSFASVVDFYLSTDGGVTFSPATGNANVTVKVSHTIDSAGTEFYETEMLSMDLIGPGFLLRESPTLQSTGSTTIRPVAEGYMISSFFDVFTELSTDGGVSWIPSIGPPHRVALRKDPKLIPPVPEPTPHLPPPTDEYVSPDQWHALFAQGIVIKDVSHSLFTQSYIPPTGGGSNSHSFNSEIDLKISTDGGTTYQDVRASSPVEVSVADAGNGAFDTEMLSLQLTGLPGVMIRESPSLPSRGGTLIEPQPDGTYRIHSFFDIFTEVSTDGGATWSPPTNGPAHVRLKKKAPEVPAPNPLLPLTNSYVSPEQWHALYAIGIIITNASHDRFTQQLPPPPPGGSQVHSFGSTVSGLMSQDGGATFQPFSGPASVDVHVQSRMDLDMGPTRFFDTEMLSLNLTAGGVMIRESPTRASTGKTSIRDAGPGDYRIGSFFDIFTEVSTDGGATWQQSLSRPPTMSPRTNTPPPTPMLLTCSADITVTATSAAGAVVTYISSASGGCPPVLVNCNPPSGSTFPIGTTTVTCMASDACGAVANCSFTVTVKPPAPEYFTPTPVLPPPNTVYISPAMWHALYANGIVIRDVRHRFFTQNFPPPPLGQTQMHAFGSEVHFEYSTDNGLSFQPATATANVTVQVTHTSTGSGGSHFDTEMLQLDVVGAGLRLRESPTLPSPGHTTLRPVPGGYMVGSFFDIFTEVSTDGGISWTPAQDAAHVELRNDPATVDPVSHPTSLLPPPNGGYVSPQQWHALFAQGIVIKDVSHKFFTDSHPPPPTGGSNTHGFNSQVDLQISLDGGNSFQSVRIAAPVMVEVRAQGSSSSRFYDTEMLSLDLTGLPGGVMIRESPTLPSRGGTAMQSSGLPPGDPDFDLLRVHSFFDIFTELSLDGGATWSPASNGPVRMDLKPAAPEVPKPTPNLPPLDGSYVSPDEWHALYASGIIITNASHDRFTQTQPPPPPGGSQTENFGSTVSGLISLNGGASFQPFSAPASVAVQLNSHASLDTASTRFFDTEMLSLNLAGGSLPGGIMVRESPTRASLGRTSVRSTPGDFRINSFFDVFTEISLDGGATWSPQISAPPTMGLRSNPPSAAILLECSPNIITTATGPAGAVVSYISSASGGCNPPPFVSCNPPSGSTFPIGVTTVTCFASDTCGNSTNCSFTVTVNPLPTVQVPDYFFPVLVLPPTNSMYISPALWHALYANGIVIKDVRHRFFTQNLPPPPPGVPQSHSFGSQIDFQLSTDNGATFQPATGTANVTVQVTHSQDSGGQSFYDTEMLQLDLVSGPIRLRESPTLQSTGHTTTRPVAGGHMIGSFFDIFTEVSLDGGISWTPAQGPAHVELRKDPSTGDPVGQPTSLLPPPNGGYVSPEQWHALFAQGIVIKDVSHKFFTDSQPPPPAGGSNTHSFNSILDLQISSDGGATFQSARVASPVSVELVGQGSEGSGLYDTEMLALSFNLPGGIMIRESPTLPSRGGTESRQLPDGSFAIDSFFDIFTELSLDGGASWSPASNGPVRMELRPVAPEVPKPTPNLPPADGTYISPAKWHALYASGIIITNASHDRFTQTQPPPPPGGSANESFGSRVMGKISLDGGASFQPFASPASVGIQVNSHSSLDTGNTRFFDTEMLSLSLSGGSLPAGLMVRESPTRASLGRTSVRGSAGNFQISSFFDVFTEISLDGGQTWSPQLTGPASISLRTNTPVPPITLTCSSNRIVTASSAAGAVVTYSSSASGGCPPVTVNCVPPSGSTFPVGTNTVNCTATDACGQTANCSFLIIVLPPVGDPCLEPDNGSGTVTLPPAGCQYLSPDEVHLIIDGLPPGTTIQLGAIHKDFICNKSGGGGGVCSFNPTNDCHEAGGTLGGEKECAESTLELTLDGTGTLAGFHRQINIPIGFETHVGPRTPGQAVQSFDTDMFRLFGQIVNPGSGDPDFDLLRIVGGTDFGLPSPGHTTLTRLGPPGSGFAVDSFFDITYRIDFVGKPGGALSGMSGSTTATIRMIAVRPPSPPIELNCSADITVTATSPSGAIVNYTSSATGGCPPVTVNCVPPSGSTFPVGTNTVTCTATDSCGQSTNCTFKIVVRPPAGDPCLEPDNGSGTVTLPPAGCQYLSPDEVHMIIDGLPPGTTIQLAAIHKGFICNTNPGGSAVCSFTSPDCRQPGGTLAGEKECAQSTLELTLDGTGALAGFHRVINLPVGFETHVGPRTPGDPVQSFDTDMFRLFGQITNPGSGDPDFDLLRIVGGTDFGLPSPGHTTLTRQGPPGSNWAVNSFFDITYRIDFVGKPGGPLGGMSGSTTATIRMVAVQGTAATPIVLTCSSNITVTATSAAGAVVNYNSSASGGCAPVVVNCVPPSGSTFPIGVTIVTCTASDACGQTTNCTFTVTVVRPSVTIRVVNGEIQVVWTGGTLQQADQVMGPYIDIDPQPTSPWTISPAGAKKFFRVRAGQPGFTFYDTEMLQLDISGGNLPAAMRLRESPTLASTGKTAMAPRPSGGFVVDSFFDVFTELSMDGGMTWQPSLGSPPRMRFTGNTPDNTLPPRDANYVSPADWHAAYASGIYLTNASHLQFTAGFPPPPPGGSNDIHTFGSSVNMLVRPCPVCPFQPVTAPAQVTVKVTSRP